MHLGQTASFLAKALGRPEPKTKMLSRLLREGGWTEKGSRGRNAPHIDSTELSSFLIALMSCPDSPAVAMERLPHFAALPHDADENTDATFGQSLAMLLERIAAETWEEVSARSWTVDIWVNMSRATITEVHSDADGPFNIQHAFFALVSAPDAGSFRDHLPYFGGLEFSSTIRDFSLYRIAKVILAGEPDPLDDMAKSIVAELAKKQAGAD